MKIKNLIKALQDIEKKQEAKGFKNVDVCIEAIEDTGDIYYESDFTIFSDTGDGEVGLSPRNK